MVSSLELGTLRPQVGVPNFSQSIVDVSVVVASVADLVPADPNRIYLVLQNISTNTVVIRPDGIDVSQTGFKLNVGGDPIFFSAGNIGPFIGRAWQGWSQGGNSRVFGFSVSVIK